MFDLPPFGLAKVSTTSSTRQKTVGGIGEEQVRSLSVQKRWELVVRSSTSGTPRPVASSMTSTTKYCEGAAAAPQASSVNPSSVNLPSFISHSPAGPTQR